MLAIRKTPLLHQQLMCSSVQLRDRFSPFLFLRRTISLNQCQYPCQSPSSGISRRFTRSLIKQPFRVYRLDSGRGIRKRAKRGPGLLLPPLNACMKSREVFLIPPRAKELLGPKKSSSPLVMPPRVSRMRHPTGISLIVQSFKSYRATQLHPTCACICRPRKDSRLHLSRRHLYWRG